MERYLEYNGTENLKNDLMQAQSPMDIITELRNSCDDIFLTFQELLCQCDIDQKSVYEDFIGQHIAKIKQVLIKMNRDELRAFLLKFKFTNLAMFKPILEYILTTLDAIPVNFFITGETLEQFHPSIQAKYYLSHMKDYMNELTRLISHNTSDNDFSDVFQRIGRIAFSSTKLYDATIEFFESHPYTEFSSTLRTMFALSESPLGMIDLGKPLAQIVSTFTHLGKLKEAYNQLQFTKSGLLILSLPCFIKRFKPDTYFPVITSDYERYRQQRKMGIIDTSDELYCRFVGLSMVHYEMKYEFTSRLQPQSDIAHICVEVGKNTKVAREWLS